MHHVVAPHLCRYAQDNLGGIKAAARGLTGLVPTHPDAYGLRDALKHHSQALRDIEKALAPDILRLALAAEYYQESDRNVMLAELRHRRMGP